jgi:uncharacterized protein
LALKDTLNGVLPSSASTVQRLRAMGVDSFHLYPRLGQLETFPSVRLPGVTGNLSMHNGSIRRELLGAQFVDGTAQLHSLMLRESAENYSAGVRP